MNDVIKLKNTSIALRAAKKFQKRNESKALVPAVERYTFGWIFQNEKY